MDRTTKTIWYKHCNAPSQKVTLHALLTAALKARPKAATRFRDIGTDGDREVVGINLFANYRALLFGQFLVFSPGRMQPLVTVDANTSAYNVEAIAADQGTDGKKREFLESIAYFGIIDDHVMLVQTRSLGSRDFEDYLLWLFQQETSVMDAGEVLTLDDAAATAGARKAATANIRGLTIGSQLSTVALPETGPRQRVTKYQVDGVAAEALKGLLGASLFDRLSLNGSLEEDNIELQITVRVKGKRTISEAGQKFLQAVGRAARHIDPRDYSVELDRNGELKGTDLKLHRNVSLPITQSGGMVDESVLAHAMLNWLSELIGKKLVVT